jgi:hypothetical protein
VLKDLRESGKIVPAIDRRYPLREVADAITYLLGGHASGKVVITVPDSIARFVASTWSSASSSCQRSYGVSRGVSRSSLAEPFGGGLSSN